MTRIRTVLFWLHLAAGVTAGVVVLIMSITGVALTYEKQVIEWADRQAWSAPPSAPAERLSPETLLARVRTVRPEAVPTMVTLRADAQSPVTIAFEGGSALLVDPTTGAIIGPPPTGVRAFFRTMTIWHRWLAMEGHQPRHGQGDHRRCQPPLSRHCAQRYLPLGAARVDFAATQAGAVVSARPPVEGPRLQLAQRDRHLVRRSPRHRHHRRRAHLVSLGEQPGLSRHGRDPSGTATGGARRPRRAWCRTSGRA